MRITHNGITYDISLCRYAKRYASSANTCRPKSTTTDAGNALSSARNPRGKTSRTLGSNWPSLANSPAKIHGRV